MSALSAFRADLRAHPIFWRLVALSGCAAFGSALPDILAFVHRVLS